MNYPNIYISLHAYSIITNELHRLLVFIIFYEVEGTKDTS